VANCAIIRVEQLYPVPGERDCARDRRYPRVEEIGWVQEEPKNRGAWTFMEPRLRDMFPDTLWPTSAETKAPAPASAA
jgi:2-oxoglutarate dehydrogenase complex dehydrogenase (E1) component-like enzyme